MNPVKKISILFFVTALLLLNAPSIHGYERIELLEEDAALIIRVSDTASLLKAIETSPLGHLWNHPKMKPFLNNGSLVDAIKKDIFLSGVGKPGSKKIAQLSSQSLELYKGEFLVGVMLGKNVDIAVLCSMSADDFLKNRELDREIHKLKGDKMTYKTHTFRGVKLEEEIEDVAGVKNSKWEACCHGILIGSTDRRWLEKCIVRLQEELPETFSGLPSLEVYAKGSALAHYLGRTAGVPMGGEPGKDPQPGVPSGTTVLQAFGINDLDYISINATLKPNALDIAISIKNNAEMRGLLAMFKKEAAPFNHRLSYVPADVFNYQVNRIDLNALWKELPYILDVLQPGSAANFDVSLKALGAMLKADIDRELFKNIDPLLTYFSRMDGFTNQYIYAIQLRQPAITETFLEKIFAEDSILKNNLGKLLEAQDISGYKLYTFYSAAAIQKPDASGTMKTENPAAKDAVALGITVADGALLIGYDKLVRSHILAAVNQEGGGGFYNSDLFKSMIRKIPDDASGYAIFDMARWARQLTSLLEKMTRLKKSPQMGTDERKTKKPMKEEPSHLSLFLDNLRYDKLPPAEFIAAFFGRGFSYSRIGKRQINISSTIYYPKNKN